MTLAGGIAMLTVAEFNDAHRLETLAGLWDDLWRRTTPASPRQTFDALMGSLKRDLPGTKLRVLVVSVAGRTLGIVPWKVRPLATRMGTVRVLGWAIDGVTAARPLGPHPAATLAGAFGHVNDSHRDWDAIDLCGADVAGVDGGRIWSAMRCRGISAARTRWSQLHVVETGGNWDDYWESRTPLLRNRVARAEANLQSRGEVRFERYRSGAGPTPTLHDLLSTVREATAHPLFDDDGTSRANEELLTTSRGALDIGILSAGGRHIAAAGSLVADGRVEVVQCGSAGNATPGDALVLLKRMLRDGFDRADRSYLLAETTDGARAAIAGDWANVTRATERLTHIAPLALRAQLLRLTGKLVPGVRRLSEAAGG